MDNRMTESTHTEHVVVQAAGVQLAGDLNVPAGASGLVIFAHGSGSSRHSSRNKFVASALNQCGLATLLFDLLTDDEEKIDVKTRELRFNIPMLAQRVAGTIDWCAQQSPIGARRIGLFGASTGAAAALVAAADRPDTVHAVVSRGGRPDLADQALPNVKAPTLLIVGERDTTVIRMNRDASAHLNSLHEIEIVTGATHLFEEPGALEQVADLAAKWFTKHLI